MTDWDDFDQDDFVSSADPNIRTDYEAALGRFILAHNEVDYRLAKALERVVLRLAPDRTLMHHARGTFENRLHNLELLQKVAPGSGAVTVDVSQLVRLNAIRNTVAHGHFDQNPFGGSFSLVGNGRGRGEKPTKFSADQLDESTTALRSIASTLNAHEIFGDFAPIYDLPPGATPI